MEDYPLWIFMQAVFWNWLGALWAIFGGLDVLDRLFDSKYPDWVPKKLHWIGKISIPAFNQ
jgi:hypothetical protein